MDFLSSCAGDVGLACIHELTPKLEDFNRKNPHSLQEARAFAEKLDFCEVLYRLSSPLTPHPCQISPKLGA